LDVKGYFLVIMGIVWISFVAIFLLAPENLTDYTVIDVAFHKTEYRLMGKTAYNFNNPKDIAKIPHEIDGWRGVDFRYPKRVYEILDADIILSRAYSKGGRVIWVDIINSDKRKSFHDPRVCYGSRWNIVHEGVECIEFKNRSSVIFDRIYVNRLDLENKRDPSLKLVVLYWFMFRGGEGVTMFRLSSPAKDYNRTDEVLKEFARDLLGLVYKEVKKPKTLAETWIERYGALGYAGIATLITPALGMVAMGLRKRLK